MTHTDMLSMTLSKVTTEFTDPQSTGNHNDLLGAFSRDLSEIRPSRGGYLRGPTRANHKSRANQLGRPPEEKQ